MESIVVIISTYNAGHNIIKQLDSIFSQIDVAVQVYIRDDQSTDDTVNIINDYCETHKSYTIHIDKGDNLGYAHSFLTALKEAPIADYYAFADQDDVWYPNKLKKCLELFDKKNGSKPQLTYCNFIRASEELKPLAEQPNILAADQLTKKIVLTETFNYGAATIFNNSARILIDRRMPSDKSIPHDLWAGALCFWFGDVHYCNEPLYFWIRYDSSVTGAGTIKSHYLYRLKESMHQRSYPNVATDLLIGYSDLLTDEDNKFLERITNYKNSLSDKLMLLFDKTFKRSKYIGSVMLKIGILLNWF